MTSTSQIANDPFDDLVLGYFFCGDVGNNETSGAVLLTDARTRPIHFAFAQPVKAGAYQKILYGGTLDEFIKVDVIAKKLLSELPRKPSILFTETPDLLNVRRITDYAVAYLARPADTATSLKLYNINGGSDQEFAGELVEKVGTVVGDLVDPFQRMRNALSEALRSLRK